MSAPPNNDCDDIRPLLSGLLDGELDAANALRCETHLVTCAACRAAYDELAALQSAIRATPLAYPPPPGFETRVRGALRRQAGPSRASPGSLARLWSGPLIGALAASLIGVVALQPRGPDLPGEVVSGHVRSLMASHLTDIAASSHHVVRPWFAGRLDFAPPVYDLAAQGYPLVGGRVDYLGGRPVAALVYRRGPHLINLFVWPQTHQGLTLPALPPPAARDGFNLRHWTHAGMTCWAVSDLNGAELAQFEALMRAQAAPG